MLMTKYEFECHDKIISLFAIDWGGGRGDWCSGKAFDFELRGLWIEPQLGRCSTAPEVVIRN